MKRVCFLGGPSLEGGHRRGQEHPGQRLTTCSRSHAHHGVGLGGHAQGTTDRTEDLQSAIPGSGGDLPPRTAHGPDSPGHYPHQPRASGACTLCLPDGHLAFSSEANSTCSTFARCDPLNRRWDGLCSSWEKGRKPGPQGPQGQYSQRRGRPEFRTSQSTSRKMCFLETLTRVNKPTSLCLS